VTRERIRNPERSFGLSVGGILCLVAAILVWRGRIGRAEWAGAAGVLLVVLGWLQPVVLRPISAPWWTFAAALGWFNARVLLTIVFAVVLAPLGFAWRLTGRDPLARKRRNFQGWTPSPARYHDPRHFDRMF
jgi:hypothetical protein